MIIIYETKQQILDRSIMMENLADKLSVSVKDLKLQDFEYLKEYVPTSLKSLYLRQVYYGWQLSNEEKSSRLKEVFEEYNNLQELNIVDNDISYLEDEIFKPLKQLDTLRIFEPIDYQKYPKIFMGLDNLRKLEIQSNKPLIIIGQYMPK